MPEDVVHSVQDVLGDSEIDVLLNKHALPTQGLELLHVTQHMGVLGQLEVVLGQFVSEDRCHVDVYDELDHDSHANDSEQ